MVALKGISLRLTFLLCTIHLLKLILHATDRFLHFLHLFLQSLIFCLFFLQLKKKDNCKIYAFHYNVKRRKVLLRKISMHVFSVCYMYLYGFLSYYLCYTCSLPPPTMVLYMYCLCFIFTMSMLYLYYLPSLHC